MNSRINWYYVGNFDNSGLVCHSGAATSLMLLMNDGNSLLVLYHTVVVVKRRLNVKEKHFSLPVDRPTFTHFQDMSSRWNIRLGCVLDICFSDPDCVIETNFLNDYLYDMLHIFPPPFFLHFSLTKHVPCRVQVKA